MIKELLKLGNPQLYEISTPVTEEDLPMLKEWVTDLHDTLMEYRKVYGAGRAVAAPQIGFQQCPHDHLLQSLCFHQSRNDIPG